MKLHLGCWKREIPGWVHVDLCDYPHIDYNRSIDNLDCFDDNSVDIIYTSHTLEYFDQIQAKSVLQEWQRVLKPKGILRLSVPDFDALLKIYEKTGQLEKILGPLFGRMEIQGTDETLTLYHKTVWNIQTLSAVLADLGFVQIEKWDWWATEHVHIDDHSQAFFPHMDKDNGIQVSLNIQAQKVSV